MPIEALIGDMVDANEMMTRIAISDTNTVASTATGPVVKESWLANSEKLSTVVTLKGLAIGNCKLLYGSERFKFYDIVICENKEDGMFGALLTCTEDTAIKILRNELADCPVIAVRKILLRLQQDTALLFTSKYTIGSQFRGQQGYTNKETGTFELADAKCDERAPGPDDDTKGLSTRFSETLRMAPRQPRADRVMSKRPRTEQRNNSLELDYGTAT